MRKITKIISIIIIFAISVLTLIFLDFKQASFYLKLKDYNIETMSVKYDDNSNLADIINMLQKIARKNNVILIKSTSDYKKENGINIYLSMENIDELNDLLNEKFSIKKLNNTKTESSFISTYDQKDDKQIGIINDLFADHFYTYYLMDSMVEKSDSLFGSYSILYKDFKDYNNFINDANSLLGYDSYVMGYYNSIENYILILIVGSLLFLLFFYFIFQIYEYYNNSKKIGCMKLLGLDTFHINKNMFYKNILVYIISLFIVLLLSIIFVKNIAFHHILFLFIINLLIILLTYLISYISCRIISKNYKLVNILKMENISLKISNISYKFKSIMTIILICFVVIASQSILNLYDKLKIYNDSKNTLEYSMLQTYKADQQGSYDFDKLHDLYLKIVNNMETIYADFHNYHNYTEEDMKNIKQDEINGVNFIYDSVDKNYLKKEKIKVYDIDGNEVNPDTFKSVCYLFPKSKKNLIDSFRKFHLELDNYYLQFNDNYIFTAYLYDDQLLDTYQVTSKYVESSILRVIDNSIKYPSFYDGLGINFFGGSMATGLKIKLIDNDKEKTIETLFKYIDDAELSNLFSRKSFITYRDYFNDEILTSKLIISTISIAIILILCVHILVSFQLLKLYIKGQKKTVLVKKMLGFENSNIFEPVYRKNLNNTLISIVISLLILIFTKKINISFVFVPIIFLVLDLSITFLGIKLTKLSTICSKLKGENYD